MTSTGVLKNARRRCGSPGRPMDSDMIVKVYLRSPADALVPGMSPAIRESLPEVVLPEGATVETLLRVLGVGRARPLVLVNRVKQKEDASLRSGDRVDLVLPIAGG